jgi:hypothetical protein
LVGLKKLELSNDEELTALPELGLWSLAGLEE